MYQVDSFRSIKSPQDGYPGSRSKGLFLVKSVLASVVTVAIGGGTVAACDSEDTGTGTGSSNIAAEDVIYGDRCWDEADTIAFIDTTEDLVFATQETNVMWQNNRLDMSDPGARNNVSILDNLSGNKDKFFTSISDGYSHTKMSEEQVEMISTSLDFNRREVDYPQTGPIYIYGYKDLGAGRDSALSEDLVDYSDLSNIEVYEDVKLCVDL